MNKVLAVALLIALAGNGYLAWHLHSRIEPNTAQLDADIAGVQAQRDAIAGREIEGSQAHLLDTILAQTQAILQQKRAATLRLVDVQYRIDGRAASPPSPDDFAKLEADLQEQEVALADAKAQLDQYVGGLIRVVVALRVEAAELNIALLKQKKLLMAQGLALPTAKVVVATPPAETIAQLEDEIRQKTAEIEITEAEARRYTGGLIQVSLLLRAETEKMTLSMLNNRRLVLKYQIGLPTMESSVLDGGRRVKAPGKVVNDKEALQ